MPLDIMPISDVLNNSLNQPPGSSVVPAKRTLDDASPEEQPEASAKRSKILDQLEQPPTSSSSHAPAPPLLPPPCDTYIQLRFQLRRFKGVYRVAQVPLTFTFKHLYAYLLLLFGWSGMHAHTFSVLSHVELYARTNRPGEIKKSRSFRIPEEPDRDDDMWAWQEWAVHYGGALENPVLRVSDRGKTYEDAWLGEPRDGDDPFDRVLAKLKVPRKRPGEVTLGDIWSKDWKNNLSKGKCSNEELAIRFEYDLSCESLGHHEPARDGLNGLVYSTLGGRYHHRPRQEGALSVENGRAEQPS